MLLLMLVLMVMIIIIIIQALLFFAFALPFLVKASVVVHLLITFVYPSPH
jgi:hypothetical protein